MQLQATRSTMDGSSHREEGEPGLRADKVRVPFSCPRCQDRGSTCIIPGTKIADWPYRVFQRANNAGINGASQTISRGGRDSFRDPPVDFDVRGVYESRIRQVVKDGYKRRHNYALRLGIATTRVRSARAHESPRKCPS